jgi:hypothetical protein
VVTETNAVSVSEHSPAKVRTCDLV